MYTLTVPVAMFGIIPAALFLVGWLRPLRGITAVFVLGWLLLPVAVYKVPMLPPYTKSMAVAVSALIALLVYDSARLAAFRPRWVDIPMVVWCLSPSLSSLDNGLGAQDAIAVFLDQSLTWGVPYLFGRLYFGDPDAFGVLTRGLVLGGILYVPLCIYEMRMAPVLHAYVYGYNQHQFLQSVREGGYRPTVFLQHGLAVSFFMVTSAMVCIWLWRRRAETQFARTPIAWIALATTVVAVLCRSTGATVLLLIGLCVLWSAQILGSKLPFIALLIVAPTYMFTRATGIWSGDVMVEFANQISTDRADSLACRLNSENLLGAHALERPLLGWAGWGRSYVDTDSEKYAIADGFWIIVLGKYGVLGLVAMTSAMLLPVLMLVLRTSKAVLLSARGAARLAFGVLVNLFVIDCLFNAMLNPIYVLAVGGLSGMSTLALNPGRRVVRGPDAVARGNSRSAVKRRSDATPVIDVPPAEVRVVVDDPAGGERGAGPDAP